MRALNYPTFETPDGFEVALRAKTDDEVDAILARHDRGDGWLYVGISMWPGSDADYIADRASLHRTPRMGGTAVR